MACDAYQKLLNDVEESEASLEALSRKTVSPNPLLDSELARAGGLVAQTNFRVRMHRESCTECAKSKAKGELVVDDATLLNGHCSACSWSWTLQRRGRSNEQLKRKHRQYYEEHICAPTVS
jgi:hypothetical protein